MIAYCLYTILCQLCFYIAYQLWFKQTNNYQWNRLFLLTSLLFACILPLFKGAFMPAEAAAMASPLLLPDVSITVSELASEQVGQVAFTWGPIIWASISAVLLTVTTWRVIQIWRIIQQSPKTKHQGYTMVHVPKHFPTCSFGSFILWPEGQSVQEHQAILLHEEAHVRERHTVDILIISLLKIIFWMSPVIWLYGRELRSQHEFLADRRAINHASSDDYIQLLVQSVLKQVKLDYAHSFHESNIKTRIKMIKSWNKSAVSWRKIGSAIALCGLLGVGIACTESDGVSSAASDTRTAVELEYVEPAAQASPATPVGGMAAVSEALTNHLKYPTEAKEAGVEGKVMISFVINTNGTMSDFKVVKSVGYGCDEAAIKALTESGLEWMPAKKDGKIVSQEMVLPINFKL